MPSHYYRRERCPICDAPASSAAPAIRSEPPAERVSFDAFAAFNSGYTSRRVFFSYSRCRACSGFFCPLYFTQAQLDLLYSRQQENQGSVPLMAREATHRRYFEIFRRHAHLDGPYLELGPDIGLFTELAAAEGRYTRFHLFEPNRDVHPALLSRLRNREVSVSVENYVTGMLQGSTLAAAVAIHVLDHLIEPAALARALYNDLAPGGMLFVVTHDTGSLLARTLRRRWPPYALQHPQLFSGRAVATLLARCGFEIAECVKTVNYFPVTHLVCSIFSVFGLDAVAPRFEHPLTVGVKLGNIATVALKPR